MPISKPYWKLNGTWLENVIVIVSDSLEILGIFISNSWMEIFKMNISKKVTYNLEIACS